ncbi:MAG: hypothetical protein DRH56_10890 [Deltaproteobacteria bacterium]|nr:MAG: hypothetical protein DRH56_10890 [Deltaproteobacteria bacterium]
MRVLSINARKAVYDQESDNPFFLLLTINHADLAEPLYFINNRENITVGSTEYTAYPFQIDLPSDKEDEISRVKLIIDNVDRQIVQTIRALTTAPTASLEILFYDMSTQTGTVEAGPFNFTMRAADYDALVVEGDLSYENILDEPFPADVFTPDGFPGLY